MSTGVQGVCFSKTGLRQVSEVEEAFCCIDKSFLKEYKEYRSSKNSTFGIRMKKTQEMETDSSSVIKAPEVGPKGAFFLCSLAATSSISYDSVYVRYGEEKWFLFEQTETCKIWASACPPHPNGSYVVVEVE